MSKIEWTDATWNPVIGCAKISAGCKNCYAETMAARVALMQTAQGKESPYLRVVDVERRRWNGRALFLPERLGEPLRWRKPRRVFVNSMSDLFHEDIFTDQIAEVFRVMASTPHLTYQVLTKRPRRMAEVLRKWEPLPNVHLGVSVEDQAAADERIPLLLQCPAALRFLSVEPLLGPVNLTSIELARVEDIVATLNPLTGHIDGPDDMIARVDWVIVGGESGPGARPCDVEWIRSVVEQCKGAGVPVFVKQLGSHPTAASAEAIGDSMFAAIEASDMETAVMLCDGSLCRLRLDDRKGADPSEWPEDLRVQEFPEVRRG